MSSEDIEAGKRWSNAIAGELVDTDFGIICLTPENLESPWLNFEAGALSKLDTSRVVPLLLAGLDSAQVQGPLAQFQERRDQRDDIFRIVTDLNKLTADRPDVAKLRTLFDEYFWRKIESVFTDIASADPSPVEGRTDQEILEEVLGIVRDLQRSAPSMTWGTSSIPIGYNSAASTWGQIGVSPSGIPTFNLLSPGFPQQPIADSHLNQAHDRERSVPDVPEQVRDDSGPENSGPYDDA